MSGEGRRPEADDVLVRVGGADDARFAGRAADLIESASTQHDIARREVEFLRAKLVSGRAALAVVDEELVAFGYWSEWEGGRFVSHSGLVVSLAYRGRGLGRRIKLALFESSRRRFPDATLMSLTTSPEVRALNLSLGFCSVPIERLTTDPEFWKGCETCRNFAAVRTRGERCCCEAMILEPGADS